MPPPNAGQFLECLDHRTHPGRAALSFTGISQAMGPFLHCVLFSARHLQMFPFFIQETLLSCSNR